MQGTSTATVTADAALAVAKILSASDHYDAIGAKRGFSTAELRQCYLRASVRVHPDKNAHPDATRAFQRVSSAWAVLGDLSARQRYDQELLEGERTQESPISPEEAFNAFAFATACAASGAADFADAETLFWATRLAQSQQQSRGMGMASGSFPTGVQQTTEAQQMMAVGGGVALSVGLWAAGCAAGAAGLPVVGAFTRRLAVFQGLGQIAAATQIPTVQGKFKEGFAKAGEGFAKLGDAVSQQAEACGCSNLTESCLGRSRDSPAIATPSSASSSSSSSSVADALKEKDVNDRRDADHTIGGQVNFMRIVGLESAQHLNGRLGEVLRFDEAKKRFQVRLLPLPQDDVAASSSDSTKPAAKIILVREQNLECALSSSPSPPSDANSFI